MTSRRWSVLILLALALGTAACGDDADEPTPAAEVTTVAPASTPGVATPTPEPTAAPSPLAGVEPCDMLAARDVKALQLEGGEARTVGAARVCRWRYEGPTLVDSYTASVELFEDLTLEDFVSMGGRRVPKIGTHRAAQLVDATGSCAVVMATGPSRVDATAVGGDHPCPLALRIARATEPRLP